MKLVVGLGLLTGCSFLLTQGPAEAPAREECTTTYAIPAIDIVGGIGAAAVDAGVWAFALCDANGGDAPCGGGSARAIGVALFAAVPSVIYFISAGVGLQRVSRCREALGSST